MHRKQDPVERDLWDFRGVRRTKRINAGLMQRNYCSGLSKLHMPLPFPYSMILFLILDSPSVFLATLSGCFKAAGPWLQASHVKSCSLCCNLSGE